ncbi:Receptor-type tyrosine-protein phosphatase zeta [Bulinus truncatus]|nr:Receptor-type tyrosine-protein phosphatase zeta [Bulinus truncatus]
MNNSLPTTTDYSTSNDARSTGPNDTESTLRQKTSNPNDITTQQTTTNHTSPRQVLGPILGSVIPCCVLLVIFVVILLKRRTRCKGICLNLIRRPIEYAESTGVLIIPNANTTDQYEVLMKETEQPSNIKVKKNFSFQKSSVSNKQCSSKDSSDRRMNEKLRNTTINVIDLITFMKSHGQELLARQFLEIHSAEILKSDVGLKDENKQKNRFKNIYAYDHSRVHLEANADNNGGDYINASYIKDFNNQVKFIASQGPNNAMINDFIQMLWEQKVKKVVMLTRLIEEGKAKCDQYWPDSQPMIFGEIEITLKSTQCFADYTIRKMKLFKKNQSSFSFTQFHYTSWPDKCVPLEPWSLIDFEQKVFSRPTDKPIVVHCSAGVGRTGTFIALHNLLTQAEETGQVDFFNTVIKLRKDRMFMVQTAEQYMFLHKTVMAAVLCKGSPLTSANINEIIISLQQRNSPGQTKMEEEFHAVCDVLDVCQLSEKVEEEFSESKEAVYMNIKAVDDVKKSKNRFSRIIPGHMHRTYLMPYTSTDGDYINAVILSGLKQKNQHILTQLPMPSTVSDFWRLVFQYNVSIVVAFEVDIMSSDETFGRYLPDSNEEPFICSPFEIQLVSQKETKEWVVDKLVATLEKQTSLVETEEELKSHSLIHLKYKLSNVGPKGLVRLIQEIWSLRSNDGKIVYMCRDGSYYSGLACTVFQMLERLESDSCVTIPQVVGSMKAVRPEVIPTLDQYKMLYQIVELNDKIFIEYNNLAIDWDREHVSLLSSVL